MKNTVPRTRGFVRRNFCVLVLFAVAGCNNSDDSKITVYRIPKETRPEASPALASAGVGASTNAPTPPPIAPAEEAAAPLQYTLPPNWQEKPLTPMRVASFKAISPNEKEVDVSVVSLPGMAGGDLANVNRWRGQVQLAPIDADTLAKSSEHLQANGHDFLFIDMVSELPIGATQEKQRIIAAILDENDKSWFVKVTGEDAAVESQKNAFADFLRSLKIP